MKFKLRPLLSVALLTSASLTQADCSSVSGSPCSSTALNVSLDDLSCTPQIVNETAYAQTFLSTRPQQSNTARTQMGTASRIHQFAKQEFNGDVSLALEWQQSTEADKIGSWFFFNGTNTMTYGPNWTAGNTQAGGGTTYKNVNALNFGTTGSGSITANPRVQNLIADLELYLGLDEFVEGLYLRFGLPVNYVRTDMRLVDTNLYPATQNFYSGDFANSSTTVPVPFTDLANAWAGNQAIGNMTVGRTIGNINGRRSETSVAGLIIELGYEFLRRETGHMGLGLLFVAPTGNQPNAAYLFEPISGANSCYQIGGTVNAAYELWSNNDNSTLSFYLDAEISHLGKHNQKRLLGLQNIANGATAASTVPSPGASWLLLKEFTTNTNTYNGTLISAANILGLVVKIGNAVMGDMALSLKYRRNNYGVSLGYNFWGRSAESACAREQSLFATNSGTSYAVKDASGGSLGTNSTCLNTGNTTCAQKSTSDITGSGATVSAGTTQYFTDADVAVCPALQPASISNKVFGTLEYTWADNEWEPYMLVAGSYEMGMSLNGMRNCTVSQWGILAKGGIAF